MDATCLQQGRPELHGDSRPGPLACEEQGRCFRRRGPQSRICEPALVCRGAKSEPGRKCHPHWLLYQTSSNTENQAARCRQIEGTGGNTEARPGLGSRGKKLGLFSPCGVCRRRCCGTGSRPGGEGCLRSAGGRVQGWGSEVWGEARLLPLLLPRTVNGELRAGEWGKELEREPLLPGSEHSCQGHCWAVWTGQPRTGRSQSLSPFLPSILCPLQNSPKTRSLQNPSHIITRQHTEGARGPERPGAYK